MCENRLALQQPSRLCRKLEWLLHTFVGSVCVLGKDGSALLAPRLLITVLIGFGGVVAAGSAAGSEVVNGPPRTESAPIVLYEKPAGDSVRLYVRGGYCRGEPPPHIKRISIHEHRSPGRSKLVALIVAYIERPAPLEFPTPPPPGSEGPTQPVPTCAGVEHPLYKRIAFNRSPAGLVLLDGSQSPPRRIPRRH